MDPALTLQIGPFSFVSVPLFIAGSISTYYLLRFKPKTPATWCMTAALGGLTLSVLIWFLSTALVLWGAAFTPAQDAAVVCSMAAVIGFLYNYPHPEHSTEARWMIRMGLGLVILTGSYSAWYAWRFLVQHHFGWYIHPAYSSVIGLTMLGTLALAIRRLIVIRRRSRLAARAVRNVVVALMLGLLQAVASDLSNAAQLAMPLDVFIIGLSLLAMVIVLAYSTWDHVARPPSLNTRLMGLSLVVLLAVLSTVGLFDVHAAVLRSEADRLLETDLARRAVQAHDLSALPDAIVAVVAVGPIAQSIYQQPAHIDLTALLAEISQRATGGTVLQASWGYYYDYYISAGQPRQTAHLYLGDHPPGSYNQYVAYPFTVNGAGYEAIFSVSAANAPVNEQGLRLIGVIVASTLFILLAFPAFFRRSLVVPLDNLLAGVRRVNAGDLSRTVPLTTTDEIGFLTESFNRMVQSLHTSAVQLRQNEARFRHLFDYSPLSIFEIDLGQSPPRITHANRQALRVYGWPPEHLVADSLDRVFPPAAVRALAHALDILRAGQSITLESISQRHDGTLFPVRISMASETGAEPGQIILILEDITAEKARRSEADAIAEERRRIAREIHDGLAQDLAALRLRAEAWHTLVERDPARLHAELDRMQTVLGDNIHEVRRSIFALRPVALEQLGFYPALHEFVAELSEHHQWQTDLQIAGPRDRLPAALEPVLFRLIQEALNNVSKHAQADAVWIALNLESATGLTLRIRDDGCGFDPAQVAQGGRHDHLGLRQMRERVAELHGTLDVISRPGQGAELHVTLPWPSPSNI